MQKYELMVILKPMLPDDIRDNVTKKIKSLLKNANGKVISEDIWGKRHLAYSIDEHEEGYYIVYKVEMDSSKANEFRDEMKLQNDILRFLIFSE